MSVIVSQAYQNLSEKQVSQNSDVGGWSFLQYLSETKHILQNKEDDTNKTPYVYPIEKRSVPKLSLEMCTESLGTENGSESGDEIISLLALEATNISMNPKPKESKTRENSFPPPLNSVNGFNCSRMVRSYGEDGRLVVQAIKIRSPSSFFVSDRREGRLRLCLSEHSSPDQDVDDEFQENENEFEAYEDDEEEGEEDDADEEAEEEEEGEGNVGNNENFEGKIGNKRSRRPKRRCNENGFEPKTMLNWKKQQFWVTT